MRNYSLLLSKRFYIRNIAIFLLFYLVFYFYSNETAYDNLAIFFVANILMLIVFLLSAINARYGFYLFIFLVPLLNTLTTIMSVSSVNFPLFLLFAFFLGFLLNFFNRIFKERLLLYNSGSGIDSDIGKIFIIFTIILLISAAITVFRYANFFPFITNNYYNLKVNINGTGSTDSIFWIIKFFFNYIIPFLIVFSLFNIFRNTKDILKGLVVLVASTTVSALVAFYQYFFNPYLGNSKTWVETGRLNATFTDPNSLGAYTILIFPIFLSLIIYFKRWYLKLIFAVLSVLLAFLIIISGSRSSLLALLLIILCYLVIGLGIGLRKIRGLPKKKKIYVFTIAAGAILVTAGFCLIISLSDSVLKSQILNIGLIKRSNETYRTLVSYFKSSGLIESLKSISNYRYIFWKQAINMTRDYPVAGIGIGAYRIELPDYIYRYERGFPLVDYTGNYYLQVLSELGVTGLILNLMIFYLIIKKAVIFYKTSGNTGFYKKEKWLFGGLFLSFLAMLVALFFGPHTIFFEIQVIFWSLTGMLLAMIKVKSREHLLQLHNGKNPAKDKPVNLRSAAFGNSYTYHNVLDIRKNLNFNLFQKIGLSLIILFFAVSFFISSITSLSIAAKQNNDDWKNEYGLYKMASSGTGKFRWIAIDASTVLEKEGSELIIPLEDMNPAGLTEPFIVKVYIDNYLAGSIKINDVSWYNMTLKIPDFVGKRFTLTIISSRSWVPKELGVTNDTRELALKMGEISFK